MSQEAKYVQVKKALLEHIRTRYAAGTRIPSTAKLQEDFGVSHATINRALRDLAPACAVALFIALAIWWKPVTVGAGDWWDAWNSPSQATPTDQLAQVRTQ